MSQLTHSTDSPVERTALQSEFPLRLSVCAWCRPRELGATTDIMSHGICPRHFREMKLKLQNSRADREGAPVGKQARRSRGRGKVVEDIAQLRFPFPTPFVGPAAFGA